MRSWLALFLGIALAFSAPALVHATGKDKGKGKPAQTTTQDKGSKGKSDDLSTERVIGTVITAVERALIGDYVRQAKSSGQGLPPGLAKRDRLPPGLEKQIQRNGTLPPGLAKRELPGDLRGRLPRRTGQDYRVVGNDIVLIDTATRLILDVMKGVLK